MENKPKGTHLNNRFIFSICRMITYIRELLRMYSKSTIYTVSVIRLLKSLCCSLTDILKQAHKNDWYGIIVALISWAIFYIYLRRCFGTSNIILSHVIHVVVTRLIFIEHMAVMGDLSAPINFKHISVIISQAKWEQRHFCDEYRKPCKKKFFVFI